MEEEITLESVNSSTISDYISVGIKSYNQHYLHLWENQNSKVYIDNSFTVSVVENELTNTNCLNFLVKLKNTTIGIVKLVINAPLDEIPADQALLAEKIYLLRNFSGKGYGKKVLAKIEQFAKSLNKQVLWLDTMQKGSPINFYLKTGFTIRKESELKLPGAISSEKPMWVLTKQL